MEYLYIAIVVMLFVLAISDLIVGVSNDAVNFVGSAVGSRTSSFRVIMIITGVGVLIGSVFSSGMMEIARKGLINPEMFLFQEIMIIFLAVMMTDILLLDLFNTFGLPTSTTVSMIFEILGAGVAMSIIKISGSSDSLASISEYINTGKVLAIISGILVSVVIAFSFGALIQYITRLLFTFRYEKRLNYYSGIFGGLALTTIIYFLLIKGMKDSALVSKEMYKVIMDHLVIIMVGSFVFFGALLQILHTFLKVNVLKVIVLAGTFALAMAFAGNDLVNFIGVPIAGFKAYQVYEASGVAADSLTMGALNEPVQTDVYLLIIAGLIMVLTLWLSKKARTVVETSIQLSKQDESGKERFGSSLFGRVIVQGVTSMNKRIGSMFPAFLKKRLAKRLEQEKYVPVKKNEIKDKPAFDLLRAAVNTIVASILIALGTSLKLPLSTTYVTFMVAMGTSLADGAWGRDTAVYRVTGVLTVISGWFFTAIVATLAAAVVLTALHFGGIYGIIGMTILILFLLVRSHLLHKSRESESKKDQMTLKAGSPEAIVTNIANVSVEILSESRKLYEETFESLFNEDRKMLKQLNKQVSQFNKTTKRHKEFAYQIASSIPEEHLAISEINIQVFEHIREITYCFNYITVPAFIHVNNVHRPLPETQQKEMKLIVEKMGDVFGILIEGIKIHSISQEEFTQSAQNVVNLIEEYRKEQIKRMKDDSPNYRTNLLYLGFLHETQNMINNMTHLVNTCQRTHEIC